MERNLRKTYAYDAFGNLASEGAGGFIPRPYTVGSVAESIVFTWDGLRLIEAESSTPGASATTLTWDYDPGTFAPQLSADAP